jgi:hypothetical protein
VSLQHSVPVDNLAGVDWCDEQPKAAVVIRSIALKSMDFMGTSFQRKRVRGAKAGTLREFHWEKRTNWRSGVAKRRRTGGAALLGI